MSRQVEHALLSMMPAHGPELPPSLVELAGSLLAQSRNRASTLKADEEVARHYACANIACERLKIALNLPPIEPRPPIPPRIYKRLYTHLDNILPNPSATPRAARTRTPSSKQRALGGSPASAPRPLPSRATPTKERVLSQFRTPSKAGPETPTRSTGRDAAPARPSSGLLPWVQPVVRFLCAETGNSRFAPTVLAGVEFVVATRGQGTDDGWAEQHATDLVAAIFFFVVMRLRAVSSGEAIDRQAYVPLRKEILVNLAQARANVEPKGSADEDAFWQGWKIPKSREFDAAVAHVTEKDWLEGDWYKAIADIISAPRFGEQESAHEGDDEEVAAPVPARRADTMLQDKYDLLSESRRSDYVVWKEKMLSRIDQAVAAGF
ncbi:hypothetical protein CDD83_11234 [Cordyceps sp. RAO-2017]|nr:hypothetical protein CDD83_11234 [Cordyceps sp. RAO-2017]